MIFLSPEEVMTCFNTIPHLLIALYLRSWKGWVNPCIPTRAAAPTLGTTPSLGV